MRIAFDAKRAFQNTTGLGHYSRTLISSLATYYPEHDYYLMAPRVTSLYQLPATGNMHAVTPDGFGKVFPAMWRSNWVKQDMEHAKIELYHGLSHEIPVRIQNTNIRPVVTMHDLIFERYPRQYKAVDVAIYRKKFRYACQHADHIIAISEQTKKDLVDIYKTPAEKITVCYQSCSPIFGQKVSVEQKKEIQARYNLPEQYLLYVGSIIERKNLLTICKALKQTWDKLMLPLVVIGSGHDAYYKEVKEYIQANGLDQRIIFLSEQAMVKDAPGYKSSADFPAIYQLATAMIYPSIFEGFGLPVLEALWSGLPVITSNISCLPEAGGDAAYYINPLDENEMADAITYIATNELLRMQMAEKGFAHARRFDTQHTAAAVMNVYERVMK